MKLKSVTLPKLVTIAGTRGMLGFGAGLLTAPRLDRRKRKVLGWVLLGVGVLSTIPLAMTVFGGGSKAEA